MQKRQFCKCQNRSSRHAESDCSNTERNILNKVSPSCEAEKAEEAAELSKIIENCELHLFAPETAVAYSQAVERLFYANAFKIGPSVLPRQVIRRTLKHIDGSVLHQVERKLENNTALKITNSSAYLMTTIFNEILESETDLMVDTYLNSLKGGG